MAKQGFHVEFTLFGDRQLAARFNRMAIKMQKRVLRKVVNAGGNPVLKAMRLLVPVRTGALRKSLGKTVRVAKRGPNKGLYIARVGPRKGFHYVDDQGKKRDPERYGIPVEFGTKTAAAKPYVRPAVDQAGPDAMSVMETKMREELAKL